MPEFPLPARRIAAALALCLLMPIQAWSQASNAPPIQLKFADFFRRPVGPAGLALSQTLLDANGGLVRLTGYMVAQERPMPGRFLFTPRPVQLSEHADGDADDLPPATVTVLLDDAHRDRLIAHERGPITLTGRLSVGRVEEVGGRVSWIRLYLPPEATAPHALDSAHATATLTTRH